MLRFLLHGATNWRSSNFGDFLYAYEIYRFLKQDTNNQVGFYDPSDYFVKYLNDGTTTLDPVDVADADFFIYIPGGYFGEGHNASFRDTLIQYIRFMPFGLKAVRAKKKLMIIGVGAGPIDRWFMKSAVKRICKNSIAVTTRDVESQEALQGLGIDHVPEYSDMMIAYDLKSIAKETEQILRIQSYARDSKLLLVHYNHSLEALEKFAIASETFVKEHKDYKIVVTADSILPYENEYFEKFCGLCKCDVFHFIYDDPFELIKLIEITDTILTCKLHIGVVGCMMNRPVICAAEHPEKTMRFYDLIGQPQNCVSLYDSSADRISQILDCLFNLPISIPVKETEKAENHWHTMQRVIGRNYEE